MKKQTWRLIAVSLFLLTSSTRCSTMDGPEAAAKNNFSEWAVNIRIPYRSESFQTIKTDSDFATVLITVDLKINGQWTEKTTEIHCEKVDEDWQCDRAMHFK